MIILSKNLDKNQSSESFVIGFTFTVLCLVTSCAYQTTVKKFMNYNVLAI